MKKGFTLVEVLLSLALLSLLGLMLLQWQSQIQVEGAADKLEKDAVLLLGSLAEELRAGFHGDLLKRVVAEGYYEVEQEGYTVSWRKSNLLGNGKAEMDRLWQLEIKVCWADQRGMVKERALYLVLLRHRAGF